jgi:hypothetical protein
MESQYQMLDFLNNQNVSSKYPANPIIVGFQEIKDFDKSGIREVIFNLSHPCRTRYTE